MTSIYKFTGLNRGGKFVSINKPSLDDVNPIITSLIILGDGYIGKTLGFVLNLYKGKGDGIYGLTEHMVLGGTSHAKECGWDNPGDD